MTKKKSFFKEKTISELKAMNVWGVETPEDLVATIQELGDEDALLLDFGLTPARFGPDPTVASRRNLRHGFYCNLNQPYSAEQAEATTAIPLDIRQTSMDRVLARQEENVFCLGYSFRPIIGADRRRVYVPFWSVMEGCKRDTYDQWIKQKFAHLGAGSSIEVYDDNPVVKVSSSTKGQGRYRIRWKNVCVDEEDKRVKCWGTRPVYEGTGDVEPTHKVYNIALGNDQAMIYPHDVHSHQVIVREHMREHNLLPLERSQYAIPSRMAAAFWGNLDRVLVADNGLRKLHIDEKSMMISRLAAVKGVDEVLFWDAERDGRIRDYEWS